MMFTVLDILLYINHVFLCIQTGIVLTPGMNVIFTMDVGG